jgi:hypothetical protein
VDEDGEMAGNRDGLETKAESDGNGGTDNGC